jgi:hypothetical protein
MMLSRCPYADADVVSKEAREQFLQVPSNVDDASVGSVHEDSITHILVWPCRPEWLSVHQHSVQVE